MHLLFLGATTAGSTLAACTRSSLDLGNDLIFRYRTNEAGDGLSWWGQDYRHRLGSTPIDLEFTEE